MPRKSLFTIEERKLRARESGRKYALKPESKIRAKEYARKYRQTDKNRKYEANRVRHFSSEYLIRKKERESSPQYKSRKREWQRRYRQTSKFKENLLKYNNSPRGKQVQLEYQRKRRYGMKLGEWDAMFLAQGSKCAICKTAKPGAQNWHTDHCHSTKKIRGILCHNCNHMLGGAKDNIESLKAAILYLS